MRISKKICFVIRNVYFKVKYGKNLVLPWKSKIASTTCLSLKSGIIHMGKSFSAYAHTLFAAVEGGRLMMGDHVFVNRNCIFVSRKSIQIGSHCSFGPNVCIYDHDHSFTHEGPGEGYTLKAVVIEDHCWIGAGCIILKGTHIGTGTVIGAGCVVTGDIPPYSLVTANRDLRIERLENRSNSDRIQ